MKSNLFKKFIATIVFVVMLASVCACGGNGGKTSDSLNGGSESQESQPASDSESSSESISESSSDGGADSSASGELRFSDNVYTVDLCDEITREYINATTDEQEYEIMSRYAGTVRDSQTITRITIKSGVAPFTVRIADNEAMTGAEVRTTATKTFAFGGTAIPGATYYYEATDGSGELSERGTIKTADFPIRIIKASGGRNIRDEGGWATESGNKVKYGLLYRGAQLNGYKNGAKLTEEGIKTFRDALGIKTELDLRGTNDSAGQTECYFGSDRNYRMISISQYDRALSGSKNQIKEIFDLLADESNYPVYFHCNAGADRTGTIAFLLNGLLGVSERDLTKDFELTSFGGQGKRLRSKDTGSGYDDSGVYQDDSSNYVAWGRLVDYIKKNYVKGEVTTLSEGIEKYLLGIGVSQNDLNKIKVLMLGLKEKADDRSAEATCEKGGVKVYELNGKDFTVETPAFGHDFVVEGGKATCKNCELSGDYVHLNADSSSAVVFSEELSLSGVKVTDKFGSDAGTRVSFTKSDASDEERIYIAKTADKTVITGVTVWSKIIKTADDLKNANAYTTTNVAMRTIKGYFLIGENITLGEKWKETYSIGYNASGYTFSGLIEGNGKTINGLDTEKRAGLVYAFSGEIGNLTVKGEATEDNSQFLCASSYGGKVSNVKLEVLLGEKPIETANSAVLGNIGENGGISELYLENVTVIETSATEKKANRKKSSALGKMYNETDKSKLFINGLTVVGVRPLLTATFDDSDVAGEVTLKSFLGENVQSVKVYNTIASYSHR